MSKQCDFSVIYLTSGITCPKSVSFQSFCKNVHYHFDCLADIEVSTVLDIFIMTSSGLPPKSTCRTAGLSPPRPGPSWRNEWAIIQPAATKKSLSKRHREVEESEDLVHPQKEELLLVLKWEEKRSIEKGRMIQLIQHLFGHLQATLHDSVIRL